MRNITLVVVLGGVLMMMTQCRKAEIPGPQGEQGEKGIAGIQGENGEQGDPGNEGGLINVIYSDWNYVDFVDTGNGFWRGTYSAEDITSDVLNKGKVIVYFKKDGEVFKLDYYKDDESITQRLELGTIWLYGSFDTNSTQFRYVIVRPQAMSGEMGVMDFDNYEEVSSSLGLPENNY